MKSNSILFAVCLILAFPLFRSPEADLWAQNNDVATGSLFDSSQANSWEFHTKMTESFHVHYGQSSQDLLRLLEDKKTSYVNQCVIIYYLGKMRMTEASKALAERIDFQFDYRRLPVSKEFIMWDIKRYPALEALVEIGNPSLPAVMRNLAESDNVKVRELSLQVIVRIDSDKDISQLRLQKAIKAEMDPQKQARLQTALKTLVEGTSSVDETGH